MSQCQAAVAQGIQAFGRVDILFCCTSEGALHVYLPFESQHLILTNSLALVGTVEELAASQATLSLVREQFETNYFTPVNIIKAVLPSMRKRISGHIILLTSISKQFIPQNVHSADEKPSWPPRHSRSGDVLCLRLGNRRVLRCEHPFLFLSKNSISPLHLLPLLM